MLEPLAGGCGLSLTLCTQQGHGDLWQPPGDRTLRHSRSSVGRPWLWLTHTVRVQMPGVSPKGSSLRCFCVTVPRLKFFQDLLWDWYRKPCVSVRVGCGEQRGAPGASLGLPMGKGLWSQQWKSLVVGIWQPEWLLNSQTGKFQKISFLSMCLNTKCIEMYWVSL